MLEPGTRIKAIAQRVEQYGAYFNSGESTIVVLIPEIAWVATKHPAEVVTPGQTYDVLILREATDGSGYVGSLKRLRPDENPYLAFRDQYLGKEVIGVVQAVYPDAIRVRFESGLSGDVVRSGVDRRTDRGDRITVVITSVDPEMEQIVASFVDVRGDGCA